uniref:Uncharacterized protein n=1 Tax=Electrophorus electricus TaxID=8005 RepID=A0A4W4F1W5_ELEEL
MNHGCVAAKITEAHCRAVHHLCQNKGSMFSTKDQDSYNLFLSSAVTDGIKLWDLRTTRCVRRYESHLNRRHCCTVAVSPCGRYVATGSEDNCAYVYDIRSSSFLHKLQRQSDTVLNVAFNPATPEVKLLTFYTLLFAFAFCPPQLVILIFSLHFLMFFSCISFFSLCLKMFNSCFFKLIAVIQSY